MLIFEQENKFHVFTSPHEHLNFTTLVSTLHVYIKHPIDTLIVALSKDAQIHNLSVVENFEVLFHHTPVVEFELVIEADHYDYQQLKRVARFMRDVYGYRINVVQSANLGLA